MFRPANIVSSYSVIWSDWNSLCGDVIFDSFNWVYRDDDSILDQKYEKQLVSNFVSCYKELKDFSKISDFNYEIRYVSYHDTKFRQIIHIRINSLVRRG